MLFGFQVRAARAVARWTQQELAAKAEVDLEAVIEMEGRAGPAEPVDALPETDQLRRIVRAFDQAEIWFADSAVQFSPRWGRTGAQIRAAQAILGWTIEELAQKAGAPAGEVAAIAADDLIHMPKRRRRMRYPGKPSGIRGFRSHELPPVGTLKRPPRSPR